MKLQELVNSDPKYKAALRAIYTQSLIDFILVFYVTSGLLIYTSLGQNFSIIIAKYLPDFLFNQFEILRMIDNTSHISYLVGIVLFIGVGLTYSFQIVIATEAACYRLKTDRLSVGEPLSVVLGSFSCWFILTAIVLFSGTISNTDRGSSSGGWLLWPLCGLVLYSQVAFLMLFTNITYLLIASSKK
jgi:hypothetical protein